MRRRSTYWLLCVAALGLVVAHVALHLRGAGGREAPPTSVLNATITAKMATLLGRGSEGGPGAAYGAMVVDTLDEAAREGSGRDRARALRRKAIWCDFEKLACASAALDELATIPAEERAPAPADEVEVLREVVGGRPIAGDRLAPLEARIEELPLGWFDHLLRERLHRHAGLASEADADLARARRGGIGTVAAMLGFGALMMAGGVAWLVIVFMPARAQAVRRLRERLAERAAPDDRAAAGLMVVVVVFLGVSLGLGPLVGALGLSLPKTPLGSALVTLGAEVLLGLVVFVTHRVVSRGQVPPPVLGFSGSTPRRAASVGVLVYLLLLPAIFAILIPLGALFKRLGIPTQGHPIVGRLQDAADSPAALAVWLIVAAIAAPLLEEAVFRGALQGGLRARLGGWGAVAISSVAFAIIHPQIGLGLVGVLGIGVTLALVREHERSLWPSVVVHALNNGFALALAMVLLSG